MNFTHKNVVITGGTSGIGLATAKAFIQEGAHVWIMGRSQARLQQAATALAHPHLHTIVSDTATMAGVNELEKTIKALDIRVDVLFINAGVASFAPIETATETQFDDQFATNVKGAYFTLQKMLPFLANGSSVLFTSSTNATARGIGSSIYSATKAALNKIAQIAANELASKQIRVNIVSPGPTETPGLTNAISVEVKQHLESVTSIKRIADASEIAQAVLFLASDKAQFITGSEFVIDGGLLNNALK